MTFMVPRNYGCSPPALVYRGLNSHQYSVFLLCVWAIWSLGPKLRRFKEIRPQFSRSYRALLLATATQWLGKVERVLFHVLSKCECKQTVSSLRYIYSITSRVYHGAKVCTEDFKSYIQCLTDIFLYTM